MVQDALRGLARQRAGSAHGGVHQALWARQRRAPDRTRARRRGSGESGVNDEVVFDYLKPDIPVGLRLLDIALVRADKASLKGYGEVVRDPQKHRVEIVPWPLAGWRQLDAGTGIEGGTT